MESTQEYKDGMLKLRKMMDELSKMADGPSRRALILRIEEHNRFLDKIGPKRYRK